MGQEEEFSQHAGHYRYIYRFLNLSCNYLNNKSLIFKALSTDAPHCEVCLHLLRKAQFTDTACCMLSPRIIIHCNLKFLSLVGFISLACHSVHFIDGLGFLLTEHFIRKKQCGGTGIKAGVECIFFPSLTESIYLQPCQLT